MSELDPDAILRAKGLWRGPVQVRALKGGYLNEVLMVETGSDRLVLKRFAVETTGTLFPNRPADEARALDRLAGLGVAPRLRGYWPEERLLVYDYAEGAPWRAGTADVARVLLRKEAADPTGFRSVPCAPADILAQGDALFARCAATPARVRPACIDLPAPDRMSLIHTDLGPSNLIGEGDGLRIIDWQCPACGDLAEDIYSFLSPAFQILSGHAPLSGPEVTDFARALARPDLMARHAALRPFLAWRMAAYCLWRSETRAEADVRARYAQAYAAEMACLEHPHAD